MVTDAVAGSSAREDALRAVVADDSHFMRAVITDALESGGIEVVEAVGNGSAAVAAVAEHQPDVVTMDHQMPELTGVEAVERIMAETPTPVLMLSAHAGDGAAVTFEALERGAVDVFAKPGGEVSAGMAAQGDQLRAKVREAAAADVAGGIPAPADCEDGTVATGLPGTPTVVVASSTGGPPVVEGVLDGLPAADLRVVVVQHMPDGFTDRFAERLDDRTGFDVSLATEGARVGAGEALVAPGDRHLEVTNYAGGRLRCSLSDAAPVAGIRPAADVAMRTAAEVVDDALVGVVLTGMGRDGAAGVEALVDAGGAAVAQDEATAAVYGMPQRAAETGLLHGVHPAEELADGVVDAVEEVAR